MTIDKIDLKFVKQYLRVEEDFTSDDIEISLYIQAARAYLMKRCSMTEEKFNNNEILAIPLLMLISEFYISKSVNIQSKSKVNPIINMFIAIEAPIF